MKRHSYLAAILLFVAAMPLLGQTREDVERNFILLREVEGCHEGFDEATEGTTLVYSSFRPEPLKALLSRASTGTMAIAWKTPKISLPASEGDPTFVVMAGIYGQEPSGYKFQMSINGLPRFTFPTTPAERWEVGGQGGGKLRFIGVTRDKFGDRFGCLFITIPRAWVTAGAQSQIRVVGEKANHSAWFMVFEASDVVAYQRELVENETYCELTITGGDGDRTVTVRGPSHWEGRELELRVASGGSTSARMENQDGASQAIFRLPGGEIHPPLVLRLEGSRLFQLDSLFQAVHTSLVHPRKLISLSASPQNAAGWRLEYRSRYHPGLGTSLQDLSRATSGRGTQHLIVSTHQDIAWMDSPENCIRDRDEKIITPLLGILKENPAYRFDLEDVLCIREYLDRHPGRRSEIHTYLREGMLGVGASYNQPYEDLCSGEMLIRQFYAGRRWLRAEFPGADTKTYWNPDVPGRTLQMAQIMRGAEVEYLVMSRFARGLYDWFSPDGSKVLAFSPGHYADLKARVEGATFEQAAGYVASSSGEWLKATGSISPDVPLVSMSDMSGPDRYDHFIQQWESLRSLTGADGSPLPLSLPPVRYSKVEDYLSGIAATQAELPAIRGDRPNIWLYIHGPTHHHAISAKREADQLLPSAEIFCTVDAILRKSFRTYPQLRLTAAWEAQLYPDHGWGGKNGEITDSTFKAKYEFARDEAQHMLSASLTSVASRVAVSPAKGLPLLVFNSLSWKRSAPVRTTVQLKPGFARGEVVLTDAAGQPVPLQLEAGTHHPDGTIATATLTFVAQGVPSIGYTTYYLRPAAGGVKRADQPSTDRVTTLENRFYRITLGSGGTKQIFDKELQEELLSTDRFLGGELFTMQSIGEDAGEWDEPQQPTMEGFDRMNNHGAVWRSVENGPVRHVVECRATLSHTTVVQRIILYDTVKRIDFETSLLGWDGTRYREFRLAFPFRADRVAYEVPFGVLEVGSGEMKGSAGERYRQQVARVRPRAIQSWIGASGQRFGVTLTSSVAVWDYQDPTDSLQSRLMLQPVLLASRRSCHGEGPWYLQAGDHHYRFSLTSHASGWKNGRRQGVEASMPLYALTGPPQSPEANLSPTGSFLSLNATNLVLSTMKKSEDNDAVVLRLYEDAGDSAAGSVTLPTNVLHAVETNLLEEGGQSIPSSGAQCTVRMPQHAIRTYKISPKW